MKKILLLIALISLSASAQKSLTTKRYNKILKNLELNIVNKEFVNESTLVIKENFPYSKLWEDALFEEGINLGTITKENTTNSRWQLEIFQGGFSGRITDIENDHNLVLKFSSKEKMNFTHDPVTGEVRISRRSIEFKNNVKVIFSEIMKSIK